MKKISKIIVSTILTLTLILSAFPVGVFNAVSVDDVSIEEETETENTAVNGSILEIENTELTDDDLPFRLSLEEALRAGYEKRVREENEHLNTIILEKANGERSLFYYDEPVKYFDEDGAVRIKSSKILQTENNEFVTASSDIKTVFPSEISKGISLSHKDISLALRPQNISKTVGVLSKDGNEVTYSISDNVSYKYSLTLMGFKEDIIVKEYNGQTTFEFVLETNGLTLINENGAYVLKDSDGITEASLGEIILLTADDRNNSMGTMTVSTIKANSQYLLTINVDGDWLADEKTTYPIIIDPTISIAKDTTTYGSLQDVVVGTDKTHGTGSGSLYVGVNSDGKILRALMRFADLDVTGYVINEARIELRDLMCQSKAQIVECCIYTGNSWSDSLGATWEGCGEDMYGTIISSKTIKYGQGDTELTGSQHRYSFDITELAQAWADGRQSPSDGVIFKATDEFEASDEKTYKTFASINRSSYNPSLFISFYPEVEMVYGSDVMKVNTTLQLSATVTPIETDLVWASSDTSIATVDQNGLVTAISTGEIDITACAENSSTAVCHIKVVNNFSFSFANELDSYIPTAEAIADAQEKGEVYEPCVITVKGDIPHGTTFQYVSTNTSRITVDSTGQLTFLSPGIAVINVYAYYNGQQIFTNYKTFFCRIKDGVYKLANSGSWLYMSLVKSGNTVISSVVQRTTRASALQSWVIIYLGSGYYCIRSMYDLSYGVVNTTSDIMVGNIGTTNTISDVPMRARWKIEDSNVLVSAVNKYPQVDLGNANDMADIYPANNLYPEYCSHQRWFRVLQEEGSLRLQVDSVVNLMYVGDEGTICDAVIISNLPDTNYELVWEESTYGVVAEIDQTGKVIAKDVGKTVISVIVKGVKEYVRYEFVLTVEEKDTDYDGIKDANDSDNNKLGYTSQFTTSFVDSTQTLGIDFTEFFFNSTQYSENLAKASSILSSTTYSDTSFNEKKSFQLLQEAGMLHTKMIQIYDKRAPTPEEGDGHNTTVHFGFKTLTYDGGSKIIVAVVIRGTTGAAEWSSDVDIGDTRTFAQYPEWSDMHNHMGFDIAATRVLEAIEDYVEKDITRYPRFNGYNISYWITGHSRGAAIANLVSSRLIDSGVPRANLFAYTFACPGTTTNPKATDTTVNSKYNSIFNIVNADDLIPAFPSSSWGFTRYGRTASISVKNNCKAAWEDITDFDYECVDNVTFAYSGLVSKVPTRMDCYNYMKDSAERFGFIDELQLYDYTESYPDTVMDYCLILDNSVRQCPMFLIKYFVAVAGNSADEKDFLFVGLTDDLNHARSILLLNLGLPEYDSTSPLSVQAMEWLLTLLPTVMKRVEYPHQPTTYILLTSYVNLSDF